MDVGQDGGLMNGELMARAMTTGAGTAAIGSSGSANALLATARRGLLEAAVTPDPGGRFVGAYLAALRAATAVLAVRAQSRQVRTGPRGVWHLLQQVAPELSEWAGFFVITAGMRAAIEAGASQPGEREADDLLRDAELFCARVASMLTCDAR